MLAAPIKGLTAEEVSRVQLENVQKVGIPQCRQSYHPWQRNITQEIKAAVPCGSASHKSPLSGVKQELEGISDRFTPSEWLEHRAFSNKKGGDAKRIACQVGTLGSGNHFLEVLKDASDGSMWIMVHSGSRNIGNRTATHYHAQAMEQDALAANGLAFLDIHSAEGGNYVKDMLWCQEYASLNRERMARLLGQVVQDTLGAEVDFAETINVHHNFCQCERCRYKDPRTGSSRSRLTPSVLLPLLLLMH